MLRRNQPQADVTGVFAGQALRPGISDALQSRFRLDLSNAPMLRLTTIPYHQRNSGLRGAIRAEIRRNPLVLAAHANAQVADRRVWRELMRYTPVVSASLDASEHWDRISTASIGSGDRNAALNVTAKLQLWDSGARMYGVKSARSERQAARYDALATRDQATLKVIDNWTQLLAKRQEKQLMEAATSRLKKLRRAVSAREKGGFASVADIADIDASIAAIRQNVAQIEVAIKTSQAFVSRYTGRLPSRNAGLPDFSSALPDGKTALLGHAYRRNPQLRAAAFRYRSQEYASRKAFARHLPSVDLTGNYRKTYEKSGPSTTPDGFTVGVRLTVPILDLATAADTSAEYKRREVALHEESAVLDDVRSQIDLLWAQYESGHSLLEETRAEVSARSLAAKAAMQRFRKGFGSLDDAVRAEASLMTAMRNRLQAEVQQSLLPAQLLLVAGLFNIEML